MVALLNQSINSKTVIIMQTNQPKRRRCMKAPIYREEVLANSIPLSDLFTEDKNTPKFYVRNGILLTFIK